MGYRHISGTSLTDAQQRVLDAVVRLGSASPHQIWHMLQPGLGKVMIQRHLKALASKGLVKKVGSPPRVYYLATATTADGVGEQSQVQAFAVSALQQSVLQRAFGFDADFTLYRGEEAFKRWFYTKQVPMLRRQRSSKLDFAEQLQGNFYKLLAAYIELRQGLDQSTDAALGLIDATDRYRSIHHSQAISRVFYQDFYSLPQFGKTLLGLTVQKAKVGEESSLPYINELASLLQVSLPKLVATLQCDGCIWVPHTIRRNYALQDILKRSVHLAVKQVGIVKVVAGDVVPQKSISELDQRLNNARLTNHISESPLTLRKLKSVLMIDDAIGSNATMQAIACKLKAAHPSLKIYAFAVVGSFKGFDVIRDI